MGRTEEFTAASFRFVDFELDRQRRTLRRSGADVELRPLAFDALGFLVRNAGRVVTKDELIAAVWPGLVVTDDSIARCISDIRRALGDVDQRIVKTVPRRGYVLAVPVTLDGPGFAQPEPAALAAARVNGARPAPVATAAPEPRRPPVRAGVAQGLVIGALVVALGAALAWALWSTRQRAEAAAARPGLSIVVLPLAVIGAGEEQVYFADGLAEDLNTDLSAVPGSFVIARGSARRYRGQAVDLRRVGQELGVRYAVEGSVQRLDGTVRLNLRLVDTDTLRQLWAERLEGRRDELPEMQARIVGRIARALNLSMVEAEAQRARRNSLANPDAQDLVWQAWAAIERKTPESIERARDFLRRALVMEPSSATAWGLLSDTYTNDLLSRTVPVQGSRHEEWLAQAERAARRAYEIDPHNLFALGAMGTVLQVRGKAEDSLAMLLRQVEVDRNYAPGWHRISYTYALMGRPEQAIEAGAKAIALSPRDGRLYSFLVVIAACHLYLGHDAKALEFAKRSVQERPDFAIAQAWLAAAAALNGDMPTARSAIAEFQRLQPGYTIATFRSEPWLGNAKLAAQRERFYRALALAGLPE